MRDRVTYNAPIEAYPFDGRKSYYRYSDPTFSIFNNELSTEEIASSSFRNRHTKSIPWCVTEQCLVGKCHIEFGISLWASC
jgi:hypothetical protein